MQSMEPMAAQRATVRWPWLAMWIAATVVVALSVHVVMFDGLHVPHPENAKVPPFAIYLNTVLSMAAAITVYRLARDRFAGWSFPVRCLVLSGLFAMLAEALFRNFIMDGVVSHAWLYCLVENLASPIEYLVTGVLVVAIAPWLGSWWKNAAAALVTTAVTTFLINPPINAGFAKLVASFEYLDSGNIYNPPYGWQVDVPSYLTFLEPVIASFAICALVWDKLSDRPLRRLAEFIVLIMAMKGSILPVLLYSFFQKASLTASFLSESQFGLEILVMAAMTAAGWRLSRRRTSAADSGAQ
jgi:hypothetical protein